MTYDLAQPLRDAVATAGSLRRLASLIGVAHQAIANWDKIPAERVLMIEEATGISRDTLRPDLYKTPRPAKPTKIVSDDARLREASRRAAGRAVFALLSRDPDILTQDKATTLMRRLGALLYEELKRMT